MFVVLPWMIVVAMVLLMGYFMGWWHARRWGRKCEKLMRTLPEVESVGRTGKAFGKLRLGWLGHGTLHLELGGLRILVDPVLGSVSGMRRCLPNSEWILGEHWDLVLITHGHMDHLHPHTLKRLKMGEVLMPEKTEQLLPHSLRDSLPIRRLREGEAFRSGTVTIRPLSARHGGWRFPWQRGYRAFSYLLEAEETRVFVAGDSAYFPGFAEYGVRHKPDVAVLPIGAYAPRWFLSDKHMNPEEAAQAAMDLRAGCVVPVHFGTYRLSLEPVEEPLMRFSKIALSKKLVWSLPADAESVYPEPDDS